MGEKGRTARSIGRKRCSGDGQLRRRAEGVVRVRRSEREQVSVGGASELSVGRIGETEGRFWEDGMDVACPAAVALVLSSLTAAAGDRSEMYTSK